MLERVKEGWGGFNAMHILFAYLQKAKPIDRSLVAAILLQLDLLVNHLFFFLFIFFFFKLFKLGAQNFAEFVN